METKDRLTDEARALWDEARIWDKISSDNLSKAIEISAKNNNRATKYWPVEDAIEFEKCQEISFDASAKYLEKYQAYREKENEIQKLRLNKRQLKVKE